MVVTFYRRFITNTWCPLRRDAVRPLGGCQLAASLVGWLVISIAEALRHTPAA